MKVAICDYKEPLNRDLEIEKSVFKKFLGEDTEISLYVHEGDKVMGLIAKTDGDVVAVKVKKSLLNDEMTNINFLTLTVRTAGAKVLTAKDINSMIDAEGHGRTEPAIMKQSLMLLV